MKKIWYMMLFALASLAFADGLSIPPEQPVCRLYGIIQTFGTIAGILVAAYAGFTLASSHEIEERNKSKMLISGVVIGLIIIWIAPLIIKNLVDASSVCGW